MSEQSALPSAGALSSDQGRYDPLVRAWPRIDGVLYPLFAAVCVLYAATTFYASMHQQTHGLWSAPLDDVFIHFDYARATARGFLFQWSEGNGFSSGNTSLTYPFALALGYAIGFRAQSLMIWAALVAMVSVFAFFLVTARLFAPFGRWGKYLLPPAVLSLGALDWSLWSGMENAFHLGVWALALAATLSVREAVQSEPLRSKIARRSWLAGLAGALLFWTRPESAILIASMAVMAAIWVRRVEGNKPAIATILRFGIPGAVALLIQSIANRAFTGEWEANGAISKLAFNHPYMTPAEKWDDYFFNLKYVALRNTQHHFADSIPWGWLVPLIAIVPFFSKKTRGTAALLWAHVVGWLVLVAMNGQVRWQNERYTMAAVTWLFVLAALGLCVIVAGIERARTEAGGVRWTAAFGRLGAALTIVVVYWIHQLPNVRDQIWFFGRASRNIHDQHLIAGEILKQLGPRRVLVGDAGALIYASDRPGLDIIGLGGFHDLPFARAASNGLGSSLELIERMRPDERPDMMAIYPSWWTDLPTLFGHRITSVPVYGNVICGGLEKVIYRTDWSSFDRAGDPRNLREGERVFDSVDVADIVSEREHDYVFPHPGMGFSTFRVLPDPEDTRRDLFDGGREIPEGRRETFRVHAPRGPARLVSRTATTHDVEVTVRVQGREIGKLTAPASSKRGWSELSIDLPSDLPDTVDVELETKDDWEDYHVWILEAARGARGPDTRSKTASPGSAPPVAREPR